jgi:energy-coupling factor transporter ATP-binding protein EcfA2
MAPEKRSSPRARRRPADDAPRPFGRLVRYEIGGLFGQHDHAFDLELDEPTILTGANGTGKSTILRTINAVGSGAWAQLFSLPFKSLALRFEDAPLVRVTRLKNTLKVEHSNETWRWDPTEPRHLFVHGDPEQMALWQTAQYADLIASDPAWRRRVDLPRRLRERSAEQLQYYWPKGLAEAEESAPDWVRSIPAAFAVRFVTDQRLVLYGDDARPGPRRERGEDVRHAVAEYAHDLRRQISRELARYAAASQREDRAFPQLVVQAMSRARGVDLGELRALLDGVGQRREALQRVGLLESDVRSAPQFEPGSLEQENVSPVIKTFAEVTLRKFETLEPFRRRLQLFVDFLDQHFVEKRAVTTDEHGLIFELSDGASVQPTDLSSGEQQMLVLAYQLLFETSPGTLLLVDEPEISLHVGWQSSFVDDITEMGRDRGLQFLLASHSPVLIGGREDLKRSLDKPRR